MPIKKLKRSSRIEGHPSYHGALTKAEAESRLHQHSSPDQNTYLIRYSEKAQNYKVSVLDRRKGTGKITHFTIVRDGDDMYKLKEAPLLRMNGVFKLLEYYQKNPVGEKIENLGQPLQRSTSHIEDSPMSKSKCMQGTITKG